MTVASKNKVSKKASKQDKIIEFRFSCPSSLRGRMVKRLKEFQYDRSDVMCSFLEEWLKQTEMMIPEKD